MSVKKDITRIQNAGIRGGLFCGPVFLLHPMLAPYCSTSFLSRKTRAIHWDKLFPIVLLLISVTQC